MKYLKLSPEYQCSPLWVSLDGNFYENLSIDTSPFDEALKRRISDWAKSFEDTLNQDYPPDSGFSTRKREEDFEQAGFNIWNDIKQHYTNLYDIIYFNSYTLRRLYSNVPEYQKDLKYLPS
jgi:hypothetical protein